MNNKNNKSIIFNGVGVDTNKTDVGNYRIVSCFNNKKSQKCFVEISYIEESGILYGTIRQAYKHEGEIEKHCFRSFNDMYNVKFLFTKENVINIVNNIFKCDFNDIEVIKRNDNRWSGITQ